jgi:hypothetical protein
MTLLTFLHSTLLCMEYRVEHATISFNLHSFFFRSYKNAMNKALGNHNEFVNPSWPSIKDGKTDSDCDGEVVVPWFFSIIQ